MSPANNEADWETIPLRVEGEYIYLRGDMGAYSVSPGDALQARYNGLNHEVRIVKSKDRITPVDIAISREVLISLLRKDRTLDRGIPAIDFSSETISAEEENLKNPNFRRTDWETIPLRVDSDYIYLQGDMGAYSVSPGDALQARYNGLNHEVRIVKSKDRITPVDIAISREVLISLLRKDRTLDRGTPTIDLRSATIEKEAALLAISSDPERPSTLTAHFHTYAVA